MSSIVISCIVFAGMVLGMILRAILPEHHLSSEMLVCALAVSSAVFLILELDRPFEGMIQVSSAPLHSALEQLGR
jgi:hypothetical protein